MLLLTPIDALAQCAECVADPACTSTDGFPTICPATLAEGSTGEWYEETLTFFLPEDIVDPGSGVTASLLSITVTSITGTPLGLQVELDDPDGTYFPSSGQTSGCATVCGEPLLPGVFEMIISVSAVASAFGIEQVVNESFSYTLIINPGAGGTSTFAYTAAAGCDSLWVDFSGALSGSGIQTTSYAWDFGNGETGATATVDSVLYSETGAYTVSLQTIISELVLEQLILNSTGGGGWDDFFTAPDPYFVLTDANGTNVYTSSTADDSNSNTWSGLSIIMSNPPYTISFYDEDLLDGDDNLGSTSFSPSGAGAIPLSAGPSNAIANIGSNELVNVTDTLEIQVYGSPEVAVFLSDESTLSCSDSTLSLYTWRTQGVPVASGVDMNYAPDSSGWYTVEGTSPFGCSAVSDSILFCLPTATLPLELLTQNGLPQYLETSGDGPFYVWSENGLPTDTLYGAENALFFPSESGQYQVVSADAFGCSLESDSLLVCWPLDSVLISQDSEGTLVLNQSYAAYSWFENGLNIEGATDSILINPGAGVYTVEVSDFWACPTLMSAEWTYVSVMEITDSTLPHVYPNPFLQTLVVEAPTPSGLWDISLMDLNGKTVAFKPAISTPFQWFLGDLPSGVYLLKLSEIGPQGGRAVPPVRVIKTQ